MTIYILNIVSIPIWYFIFSFLYMNRSAYRRTHNNQHGAVVSLKNKAIRNTLFIVGIQMILIAGLRAVSVGTDTQEYKWIFQSISRLSIRELPGYYMETGYSLINKLVSLLHGDYQLLLILNSLIITIGVLSFIRKTSTAPLISLFLFIAIGYYASSLNIMRQFMALTLVLMSYYQYCWMNKKKQAYVYILLASLIHSSVIVIIPILLLYSIIYSQKLKEGIFLKALAVISGVVVILSLEPLMKLVSDYGIKSYEQLIYSAGVETQVLSFSLLIKILISCLYYFVRKRSTIDIEESKRLRFLNYINVVSCFVSLGAGYFSLLSRLNLYFSVTSIVLLPNLIPYIRLEKRLIKVMLCVLFFVYFMLALPGKDIVPWVPFFR